MTRAAIILIIALSLLSCDRKEKERQAIIEQGVQIKIDEYRKRQGMLCKQKAIDKAIVIADSLMRIEGLNTQVKPVQRPPDALKPTMPPVRQLPDSLNRKVTKKD